MTVQSTRRAVIAAGGAALVSGCTVLGDSEPIHAELTSESEYLNDVDYSEDQFAFLPIQGFDIHLQKNPPRTPAAIILFKNRRQERAEELATGELQTRVNDGEFDPKADYEIGVAIGGDVTQQIGRPVHTGGRLLERIGIEIVRGSSGGDGQ